MRHIQATILVLLALGWITACGGSERDETSTDDTSLIPQFGDDPSVPQSCEIVRVAAQNGEATTVGCEFFASGLDVIDSNFRFAIVLANVNYSKAANFTIYGSVWDYDNNQGTWELLKEGSIDPLNQEVIDQEVPYIFLNDNKELYLKPSVLKPQAVLRKGAYKIVSDTPIVAYQFNPLDRTGSYASDASVLIPVEAWSRNYQVVGTESVEGLEAGFSVGFIQYNLAYAAIVASKNGTEVTIEPTATLRTGYTGWYASEDEIVVPAGKEPFTVTLDEADVLYIHADVIGESLTGTSITSNADHPIGVFSGHQCALIPKYAPACDNVEEQLPGLEFWGYEFVAARLPIRNRTNFSDPVMWQIYASEDNTTVEFKKTEQVRGIPYESTTLQKGEHLELYVYGSFHDPGDFTVTADKPIAILQYMTAAEVTQNEDGESMSIGDPTMSYVPPVDQFLSRYIVNIPTQWAKDYLVVSRPANTTVYLDNQKLDNNLFRPVGDGEWEAARIEVSDGPHMIETGTSRKGIGLTVAGFDNFDSYAFTGGMGFAAVPPQ